MSAHSPERVALDRARAALDASRVAYLRACRESPLAAADAVVLRRCEALRTAVELERLASLAWVRATVGGAS